ncbi:C-type lectin 37Da [Drosophila grimshawi]|uniref:GH24460 n=1 Tax=Drosophila grimshawi TaxID=7222 RepID=B4JLS5_DROGR|nr:C-type lectin 37Da [Drosophila grimshawi]EDV91686.1 GH24460 [Drosophila grimshawi]
MHPEYEPYMILLRLLILGCGWAVPAYGYLPDVNIFTNYRTEVYNGIPSDIDTTPFVRIGDNYYYIEPMNKVNWFQAAATCRTMNAHLASIEDKPEMEALVKYMRAKGFKSNDYFWISGNDLGTEGAFYWSSTGRPLTYAPWNGAKQMPDNYGGNENCVHMFATRDLINDANCKILMQFVCEASDPKTFKFTYIKW